MFFKKSGGFTIVKLYKRSSSYDIVTYNSGNFGYKELSRYLYYPPNFEPPIQIENQRPTVQEAYKMALDYLLDNKTESVYHTLEQVNRIRKEFEAGGLYSLKTVMEGDGLGNPYFYNNDIVVYYDKHVEFLEIVLNKDELLKKRIINCVIFLALISMVFYLANKYKRNTPNTLRIILAVLLLLCLFDLPYGYYQMLRVFATIVFVHLAILEKINYSTPIYFILAILFQPIFKISFEKDIWNIIDIAIAIWLSYETFKKSNIKYNK
jgi:hypothetical protein